MKPIKQSVINTFKRVGIDYESMDNEEKNITVFNRFGYGSCKTTELVAYLIGWVYKTNNEYEVENMKTKVADFNRIRYFILEVDANAYSTCID
jgi:hypothetical protein